MIAVGHGPVAFPGVYGKARARRALAGRIVHAYEPKCYVAGGSYLDVPRCLFDGSGIDAFEGLSLEERLDFLGEVLRGTSPHRREWTRQLEEGRFGAAGARAAARRRRRLARPDRHRLRHRLVKSVYALPVLARLVRAYGVPVERDRIRLTTNCASRPSTSRTRACA